MEKVFINPVAKEILVKGAAKEGTVDLFSYDNNGNNKSLGNLFVIGNIQGGGAEENKDDIDVGYVLNLVASLAKREYYINQDISPKDAFSAALKKINGVVEEFFKNKETKINIGIFAVAGDQIHISKLGKFKILLAREGKNIDILNNLQLFDKESTQEKEFSNIISGKIVEGDRILAFYPSRATTSREKYIKDHFLKSTQEEFAAQLASIKDSKPDFACAALHIDIQKCTESAVAPAIQPKELQEEEQEKIINEPVKKESAVLTPVAQLATTDLEDEDELEEESAPVAKTIAKLAPEPAIPKIIPSEFARGKRELTLFKHIRRIKNVNLTPKVKMYAMGGMAIIALITIFSLKSFVFVDSATRQLNATISEVQKNIKLAQDKQTAGDIADARTLLMGSLASITQSESSNGTSKKVEDIKKQVSTALDSLDGAIDATPTKETFAISPDLGTAKLALSSGSNFYAYLEQKESNSLLKITPDGSVVSTIPVKDISPSAIFGSDAYVALIDSSAKKITSLSTSKSTLISKSFTSDTLVGQEIYQDNLYALTSNSIFKITDAALGKTDSTTWLSDKETLASGASLIAVDGNVYVLSNDGKLTTYYKGVKKSETPTLVAPETGSLLLTTTDLPNLYLVNTKSGRIYIFDKKSGSVSKVLKVALPQPIISATLATDGTVYILSDNKIWKIN
ncbi:MAG: hypothetical protein KBC81_02565 [Candidatus Pacebacteria bacterium]|nr:hypothetical protein [Candidatus Paceibacterota bacterium]